MNWKTFLETKNESSIEFFTKRKKGAAKIAAEAKIKGGPSLLTYMHFAAKAEPYAEVLQAIKENKPKSFYEEKCKSLYNSIHCGEMTQEQFQKTMGATEVWGEALAELF